jgi:hypothetical protein
MLVSFFTQSSMESCCIEDIGDDLPTSSEELMTRLRGGRVNLAYTQYNAGLGRAARRN